jgi:DNA-binding transcriptional ArsR family regulator
VAHAADTRAPATAGDADIAAAAALIGEPARAALLVALVDDVSLPAGELASRACIAASTASEHLAKLVAGGLIVPERSGRHRYFRLASAEVAAAIETLAAIAPRRPVRSLRAANEADALRDARTCYDHLAGRLGVGVARALERSNVLSYRDGEYELGPAAREWLDQLGVDLDELTTRRRVLVRTCLDWSERRRHVAGAFGAAVAERFFALGWLKKREANRSVVVTPHGREQLARLGVET